MRVSDRNIDRIYINSAVRGADYQMVENHFHYYYELYYVRHGKVRFYINNSLFSMESGDFMMVPPREIHYAHYLSQCTRINIYFRQQDLFDNDGPFTPEITERFLHIGIIHVPRTYREIIHGLLDSMLAEEKVDDSSTGLLMKLLLRQLLLYANRYCIFRTDPQGSAKDVDILSAVQYITEHYSQPISLDELAEHASLSPSYFSKKFRNTTGMGMKEYLTYTRLNHAAMELLSTNHTIMDVAMNCGFSDSNYFKDAFKKRYGLSPRAYRNARAGEYILEENTKNQYRSRDV